MTVSDRPGALRTAAANARRVDELRLLEAEAVHIIREVVAELGRPVLLFSGGKDSIVPLRLAEKAFGRCTEKDHAVSTARTAPAASSR